MPAPRTALNGYRRDLGTMFEFDVLMNQRGFIGNQVARVFESAIQAGTFGKRTSNGTYRRDVVVEILVRKRFTEDVGDDLTNADATVSLIEEIDDYLAAPENHDLTLPNGELAVYVEQGDKRADSEITNGLGAY